MSARPFFRVSIIGDTKKEQMMNANLYQCMRMNWLSGYYQWVVFEAESDEAAGAITRASADFLPQTLARTRVMHRAA